MTDNTTQTSFDYRPMQYVKVVAYGLGYSGRVTQCLLRPNNRLIYEVEYAANGEIKRGEFEADELEAA